MAGAALKPDFYNSKVNVALLLAPPVKLKNNQQAILQLMSSKTNRDILTKVLTTIHMYNILPYNYL
jgi:hypothetical protein